MILTNSWEAQEKKKKAEGEGPVTICDLLYVPILWPWSNFLQLLAPI